MGSGRQSGPEPDVGPKLSERIGPGGEGSPNPTRPLITASRQALYTSVDRLRCSRLDRQLGCSPTQWSSFELLSLSPPECRLVKNPKSATRPGPILGRQCDVGSPASRCLSRLIDGLDSDMHERNLG